MDPRIAQELNQEQHTPFHTEMLNSSKALVDMSRAEMSRYYDRWDKAIQVYKGEMWPDEEDREAKSRKEPMKAVMPIVYSQVNTFVAFCITLYTQREKFFELVPIGAEDHKAARVGEAFLQRDLDKSAFEVRLHQFLLDVARCSFGVFKTLWREEREMVEEQVPVPPVSFFGLRLGQPSMKTQMVEKVVYSGTQIVTVSPYRFFPDTRLPLSRFQEGEFVASEDIYSFASLRQMEKDGMVSGVEFIQPLQRTGENDRRFRAGDGAPIGRVGVVTENSRDTVVITEIQRVIVPADFKIDGEPLGPSKDPEKYVIWVANDTRVIKCEPLGYAHGLFTYDVGQFLPDDNELLGPSFIDSIGQLQDLITWFVNSRVASVRKVIGNKLVVDPSLVEWSDVESRKPVIRLKPNVVGRGVEKAVTQIALQDVTTNHLTDVAALEQMVQIATGVNDTLLGQMNTGRRTATENRNAATSAAARLKTTALMLYRSSIEPMGRKMLSNLQTGLDTMQVARVLGPQVAIEGQSFIKASKADLKGSYDFEVFDGTLPSERANAAAVLENALGMLVKVPQAAISLQLDPRAMFMEALLLRGIRNPERFTLQQLPQIPQNGNPTQQPGQPGQDPNGGRSQGASPDAATTTETSGLPGPLSSLVSGSGGNNG